MKKLAILLSLTSLMMNRSCDSTDEEIDLQGNNVFELQYINAGMSGEIIKKKDLEFNEFIEFHLTIILSKEGCTRTVPV